MSTEQKYKKVTTTAAFADGVVDFGFECDHILMVQDGTGTITFSWDGTTGSNDGEFDQGDKWIQFDGLKKSKVFVKSSIPGDLVRIWAWKESN